MEIYILVGLVLMQVDVCHMCSDPHGSYNKQSPRQSGGQIDASMEFLVDKWRIAFKVYDLNHDKIVDKDDLRIQQNLYINLYSLKGKKADRIEKKLSKFWNCITLDGLEHGLSMEQFVARRMEAYGNDKAGVVEKIKKCFKEFAEGVVDRNKDGYVSVKEMYSALSGLGTRNRKLAEQQLAIICPDVPKRCPVERVSDYYTELHVGESKETYEDFKNEYEDFGMPFEDLVE